MQVASLPTCFRNNPATSCLFCHFTRLQVSSPYLTLPNQPAAHAFVVRQTPAKTFRMPKSEPTPIRFQLNLAVSVYARRPLKQGNNETSAVHTTRCLSLAGKPGSLLSTLAAPILLKNCSSQFPTQVHLLRHLTHLNFTSTSTRSWDGAKLSPSRTVPALCT